MSSRSSSFTRSIRLSSDCSEEMNVPTDSSENSVFFMTLKFNIVF